MLSGGEYVAMYDSNFTLVVAIPGTSLTGTVSTLGTVVKDDILTMVTLINNNDFAWVRVSLDHGAGDPGYATAADPVDGPGSYMIVTVNEEITD